MGAPIHRSSGFVKIIPMIISANPDRKLMEMAVCTLSLVASLSSLPRVCPTTTLVPIDRPIKRLISRLVRAEVEPTAAKDSLPAKRPTTMTSAALNKSCKQPDSIKGKLNAMTLGSTGPLHISILYDFLDIVVPSIVFVNYFPKRYFLI